MRDKLEEIRQQVHEIRNLWAPVHLKMDHLAHEIAEMRTVLDARIDGLESRLSVNKFKVEEQAQKIAALLERLEWVEVVLTVSPKSARSSPSSSSKPLPAPVPVPVPAHEDKHKHNPES